MTYTQKYYATKKAKDLGLTLEEYLSRKSGQVMEPKVPQVIDFGKVVKLDDININSNMLKINKTGLVLDTIFSYEGGVPVGTNIMATGDPGVGKTTVLLHTLASLQLKNPKLKCLFVCAEMSKIQMFKYTQRFPIFGNLETIFTSDFMNYNSKEVIEQLFKKGYDYILIDSIVEVLESVKEDASMSQSQAEKWLVDLCVEHNEANNELGKYTSFLLIQQVTKAGVFVGSNKIKHITDAHMELKRDSDRDGGGTYIMFSKNRNGQAGIKFTYQLNNQDIHYGTLVEENEGEDEAEGEYTLNS
jgi:DNA repair protein RadA/Sms